MYLYMLWHKKSTWNNRIELQEDKYLGNIIDKSETVQATFEKGKFKGDEIVFDMLSFIEESPMDKHKTGVGFKIREEKQIKGLIFSMEAWHEITNA